MTRSRWGIIALVGYVSTIIAANWALKRYGIWTVASLAMPAGAFFAGLAFTLRDITQETLGKAAALGGIAAGAGLAYFISPAFAFASAVAFGVSELADFAIYQPLRARAAAVAFAPVRHRRWLRAVAVSNVVGLVVDSVLFLHLAFHSLEFLPGQIVAKTATTVVAVGILSLIRRRISLIRTSADWSKDEVEAWSVEDLDEMVLESKVGFDGEPLPPLE